MLSDNWKGWVYEHTYFAEKQLGRKLYSNEEVHHLDGNKLNNRYENLVVLLKSSHNKIHSWINRGSPYRSETSPIRDCKVCGVCLQKKQKKYCSTKCRVIDNNLSLLEVDKLTEVIKSSKSMEQVARLYGVSSNAIRKRCNKLNISYKELLKSSAPSKQTLNLNKDT